MKKLYNHSDCQKLRNNLSDTFLSAIPKIATRISFAVILLVFFSLFTNNVSAQSPLCSSYPTTFCCEYVSSVTINGVTRAGAPDATGFSSGPGYFDYTNEVLTSMVAGNTYPVSVVVKTNSSYQEFVKIWFDFNGNGTLSDAGELVFDQVNTFNGVYTYSGNVTVPANAFNGPIYIRVVMVYANSPALCGSYSYGTTLDFKATLSGGVTSHNLAVSTTSSGGYGGSVTSSPAGINTGSGFNSANFAEGSNVTLTATPSGGGSFTGWSGDASGSTNPLSITMNASKSITANFGPACTSASQPASVSASATGTTSANLSWSGSSGTAPITYYWAVGPTSGVTYESGYTDRGTTTSTSATTSGLSQSTTYYASVKAVNSCGTSAYKTSSSFRTHHTLTYTAGANGSLSGSTSQTVAENGNGTAVTATPSANYHFVNWSDGSTQNPRTDLNVTNSVSVTANFSVNKLAFGTQPSNTIAGQPIPFTVRIVDASNNTVTSATNAVTIAIQNNPGSAVPSGTLTRAAVNGVAVFDDVNIQKTGTGYTLQATSSPLTSTVSGSFNIIPAALGTLAINGISDPQTAGTLSSPVVTAYDIYNNIKTNYTGTLSFTSSDAQAVLPANYSFSGSENGTKTFTNGVILKTTGEQSVTISEGAITASQSSITVTPAALGSFTLVTQHAGHETAGTSFSILATALDIYGNLKNNYNASVDLTWITTATPSGNGTNPVMPSVAQHTFSAGMANITGFTLYNAHETPTITVTESATGKTGTSSPITISPVILANFKVEAGTSQFAGVPFDVTVTARDIYYNTVTSYAGNISFKSSNDSKVTFPAGPQSFAGYNGVRSFPSSITISATGTYWLRAADATYAFIQGYQTNIVVAPGAFSSSETTLTVDHNTRVAGEYVQVVVTPKDALGNLLGAGQTVQIYLDGAGNDYNGPIAVSYNGDGTYSANVRVTSTSAANTISAKVNGMAVTHTETIIVTTASPLVVIHTQPSSTAIAGETFAQQPVIYIQDMFGNLITNDNTTTVTATTSGSVTLSGTTSVTAVNGIVTFTNLAYSKAETITLTLSAPALTPTTSNPIQVSAAVASQFILNSPANIVAGGSRAAYQVSRYDAFGNPVTVGSTTVYLYHNSIGVNAAFYGVANGGSAIHQVTIPSGATSANFWYYDEKTGEIAITASDATPVANGDSGIADGTDNIEILPGALADFGVYGVENPHYYGTWQSVTITARDQYQNVKTDYTGTVTFQITDPGATGPIDYTFVPSDKGLKFFDHQIKFSQTGSFWVTVVALDNPIYFGYQADIIIQPMSVTLQAEDRTKAYGTTIALGSTAYSITNGALAEGETIESVTLSSAGTPSNAAVGDYPISISNAIGGGGFNAANYNITYSNNGKLTVVPQDLFVTATSGQGKIYGDSDPVFTYTATGFIDGDDESILTGALSRTPGENAGTYTISSGNLSAGSSYHIVFTPADFVISQLAIQVNADPLTKECSSPDPNLTYTFSPALVLGDTFSGNLIREAGESIGEYAILQGSLALSSNYLLTYNGSKLTIEDHTAPGITNQAADLTVECDASGNTQQLADWLSIHGGAAATDLCGSVSWTNNFAGLSDLCGNTGAATVIFTANDEFGNFSTTSATFTIVDHTSPVINQESTDLTVECDGLGNMEQLTNWLNTHAGALASDVCSTGLNWSNNFTSLSDLCGTTGTALVTFTVTDDCGNAASTQARFTIEDHTLPVISQSAMDLVVECDGTGNTAQLTNWLNTNAGAIAVENCSSLNWSNDFIALSDLCGTTGTATVTFTATDNCGNYTTTTATFTIVDHTAPAITIEANDLTVECDGAGNTAALNNWLITNGNALATDVCSSVVWSNNFNGLSDLCGATGMASVTFTATDDCGNFSQTTATFTIVDHTAPVLLTSANNLTVECDGIGNTEALNNWLITNAGATASDSCSSVIWSNNFSGLSDLCGTTGTATVTFTATDDCGNASFTVATFTIADTTAPHISLQAQNVTVNCDGNGNTAELTSWLASHAGAISSDACSGVVWSNNFTTLSDLCGATGSATVTFTATDDCGNYSATSATFTIIDTIAPAISTQASSMLVECDGSGNQDALSNWLANQGNAVASDACSGIVWANNFTALSDLCGATGSASVTFTATDDCGNSSTTTATFTIVDVTAPAIITQAAGMTVECDGSGNTVALATWLASQGGAVASDLCSDIVWSNDFTALSDLCGATGATTVTFTATDNCGNSSTTVATFTIVDTTNPEIAQSASDLTVECDGSGNTDALNNWLMNQGGAVANDNCSGTVTWTNNFVSLSQACGLTGSAQVIFTATDACGNFSTTTAVFTIVDTTAPVLTNPATSAFLVCDGQGNSDQINEWLYNNGGATATDACSGNVVWYNNYSGMNGQGGTAGSAVVTFTATDACGNIIETTATISIVDTLAPEIPVLPMLSGECSLTIVPPTTIDNCSGTITGTTTQPLVYTTQTSGVIHWTFDDLNGNVSYADQVFYIDDIIPPFVSDCPQNMIACENQPVYFNAPNGSDNCSASIVIEQIEGPASGTIFPLGTTTVAFSLTDEEGNVSYCSFQVTVQQAPDASVSQSGFTLTANLPNANYQWIDCSNNFEPIVGETFQSYNVTANGSYAVVVSNGICSDTSSCIEITTVSIITPEEGITLTVYPNPVKDNVTIKTTEPADFNIMDMNEKVVYSGRVENTLTINLNYLANGIYTLRTANGTIRRLVKQ